MRTTTLPSACAPFLLASSGTGATPPLSPSDDVLASVPIRTELNLVVLPVSVAGSEPFRLVLLRDSSRLEKTLRLRRLV